MDHDKFAGWCKSTYSNNSGNCVEVGTAVTWRKSSYSGSSGNCVEVADPSGWSKSTYSGNCVEVSTEHLTVGVRDSKQDGRGPALEFSSAAWEAFLAAAKNGKFDL